MSNKEHYRGKLRVIVRKSEKETEHEIIDHSLFDDGLITKDEIPEGPIKNEISSNHFDSFMDSIDHIIKPYKENDTIEIVADVYIEYTESWTDCGYEYDVCHWLENEKHRQLSPEQIAIWESAQDNTDLEWIND